MTETAKLCVLTALLMGAVLKFAWAHCASDLDCVAPRTPNPTNSCRCDCPRLENCTDINQETCTCKCANTCPLPLIQSPYTCQCYCPSHVPRECSDGKVFDEQLCKCQPSCKVTCNGLKVLDQEKCECVCPEASQCCEGQVLNRDTCTCQCANVPDCEEGYKFDQESCKCVCEGIVSQEVWMNQSAKCYRTNQVFNIFSCGCECRWFLTCKGLKKMHPERCRCECPPRNCTSPLIHDISSCECQCPFKKLCSSNKFFSTKTCDCECLQQDSCGEGKHRNSDNCQCECSNITPCPSGHQWSHASCSCEDTTKK